mmetsp:Transcript_58278/g.138850  ORF Transcript_58278/g.138850 Transcript_58278/m.138850 type:complete len:153 (-) Transcript_58278:73-531(-)
MPTLLFDLPRVPLRECTEDFEADRASFSGVAAGNGSLLSRRPVAVVLLSVAAVTKSSTPPREIDDSLEARRLPPRRGEAASLDPRRLPPSPAECEEPFEGGRVPAWVLEDDSVDAAAANLSFTATESSTPPLRICMAGADSGRGTLLRRCSC